MMRRRLAASIASAGAAALLPGPVTAPAPRGRQDPARAVTVTVRLDRPLARLRPELAMGGALDGHEGGEVAQIYTQANLRAMASAGLGAVAYRLRTELGAKAWQPNAERGVSSFGYDLPHRGDTIDQADDNGYSRIDDGDPASYWRSDPYLGSRYTHEAEAAHPQWVLVDLGHPLPVDAIAIDWGQPYATRFGVQWYTGPEAIQLAGEPPGVWRDFPDGRSGERNGGDFAGRFDERNREDHDGRFGERNRGGFTGRGGAQTLRLAPVPLRVRFVRVLMYASSYHGYAIRELHLGTLDGRGRLHDLILHAHSKRQTAIYVSSTDSWHRTSERDANYEQPGFATVIRSGLTRGLPLLVPVPVLYGTPGAAVAELRRLIAMRVRIRGVELGEEPDGQLASPEDYGALYVQFARAIHRALPHLRLGGPSLQTSIPDWLYWPDSSGDRSWTHRFVVYLKRRHALGLLDFFSFEWYPFDEVCAPPGPQLAEASQLLTRTLGLQHQHGVPARIPVYISEYGYSAFAGQDEVDLPGALLDADTVGTFLADGGSTAYMYGYEPEPLLRESSSCNTWGNLGLFESDGEHRHLRPLAAYWETRMLTHDWLGPGAGRDTLYTASVGPGAGDREGHQLLRAYVIRHPDGSVSVLLLNLSPAQPYEVSLHVVRGPRTGGTAVAGAHAEGAAVVGAHAGGTAVAGLRGGLHSWQLSAADYRWHADGEAGFPALDRPPPRLRLRDGGALRLPPYSITVVRSVAPAPAAVRRASR